MRLPTLTLTVAGLCAAAPKPVPKPAAKPAAPAPQPAPQPLPPPAPAPVPVTDSVTSSPAAAPEARLPQVALMPLESKGVSQEEADLISDALASRLQQSGKVSVMERSQMNQILKEQAFQASGVCDNSGCAVEMGKLLSVDRIVVGSVGKIGDAWALNLRLVKVQTGEVVTSASGKRKGKLAEAQEALVKDVVAELTGQRSNAWKWWTAGGLAVAGGVTAAILLTQKKETAPTSATYTWRWSD